MQVTQTVSEAKYTYWHPLRQMMKADENAAEAGGISSRVVNWLVLVEMC